MLVGRIQVAEEAFILSILQENQAHFATGLSH